MKPRMFTIFKSGVYNSGYDGAGNWCIILRMFPGREDKDLCVGDSIIAFVPFYEPTVHFHNPFWISFSDDWYRNPFRMKDIGDGFNE